MKPISKTYDPKTGKVTETKLNSSALGKLRAAFSGAFSKDGTPKLIAKLSRD